MKQIGGRILVTGGAGFIGSHLVERLVSDGAQVTVVDNLATGSKENLHQVIELITLFNSDLGELLQLRKLDLTDFQYVFHLAANPYIPPSVEHPDYDYRVNLHNTFLLLEALRSAESRPKLVNASSAAVYGNPVRLPICETDPTVPISPYGVSKLAAERYVAVFSQLYGIHATSLRLFSVFGPRQKKQVVYDLLQKLKKNSNRLEVLGDGSQKRDFVYVTDVVRAMILAAESAPGRGEAYNVATGISYSISELLANLMAVTHLHPDIVFTGQVRPGDAQEWTVDISQITGLGYKPTVTLEMGLKTIRDWYIDD